MQNQEQLEPPEKSGLISSLFFSVSRFFKKSETGQAQESADSQKLAASHPEKQTDDLNLADLQQEHGDQQSQKTLDKSGA